MELLNTPIFGILLTLIAYLIGITLYKKLPFPIFNPILVALVIIIPFLLLFHIPLESYRIGGNMISFFLGPATVLLAVPLYKQIKLLKKHFLPIILGIVSGVLTTTLTCFFLGKALGLNMEVIKSSLSKSVTTPIAIAVSSQSGGIPSITITMVTITGITGAIIAPIVCKFFKIKNSVARGIAIGTASHAVGTSKALEMGEEEGAMSSLAIGVAGLITVFIVPILLIMFF